MFTGIITHIGKVQSINRSRYTFFADSSFFQKLGEGSSVAVNGICLTVDTHLHTNSFSITVMPETVKKTMVKKLKIGDSVNLELSMSPSSLFEGHIMQGHIDDVGQIEKIRKEGNSHILTISYPKTAGKYICPKGSIAVNGVSLTVIDVSSSCFTVGIIPYTFSHTTFGHVAVGDLVNIEVDIIARYLEKLTR